MFVDCTECDAIELFTNVFLSGLTQAICHLIPLQWRVKSVMTFSFRYLVKSFEDVVFVTCVAPTMETRITSNVTVAWNTTNSHYESACELYCLYERMTRVVNLQCRWVHKYYSLASQFRGTHTFAWAIAAVSAEKMEQADKSLKNMAYLKF